MGPDVEVIMAVWPIAWLAAAAAAKGIGNLYSAYRSRQRGRSRNAATRAAAGQQRTDASGNIADLQQGFLEPNAAQKAFRDRLRKRAKTGALPVQELESQVGQRVGEFSRQAQVGVTGSVARAGLEGSGVAESLRRRVSSSAMQSIAHQARAIRIQNEQTKIGAQDQLGAIGDQDAGNRRNLASMIFRARSGRDANYYGQLATGRGQQYASQDRSDQYINNAFGNVGDFISSANPNNQGRGSGGPYISPDGRIVWRSGSA